MKKLRDFKCDKCKRPFEMMVDDDVHVKRCFCGGIATRLISAPKCFQNTTGKSPSASNKK